MSIMKVVGESLNSRTIFEIYLLLAFCKVVSMDSSETRLQKCEQRGFTLMCNYIPQEIPIGITVVHIIDWFENSNSEGLPSERICNEKTFLSNTWINVTKLEINTILTGDSNDFSIQLQSECFSALKELKELHMHLDTFDLNENAFVGLEKLQLLDFGDCSRLEMTQVNKALKGREKVPNLSEMSLSHAGYISSFLQLDEAFVDALTDKPVKKIDASDTQITIFNITDILKNMKHLEIFNVSNTKIGYAYIEGLENLDFPRRLRTIDISYATFPSNLLLLLPGLVKFEDVAYNFHALEEVDIINMLFSAKTLNFTKIIPDESTVCFENVTVFVDNPINWKVEELILNKNNLERLNCQVVFGNNTVPTLKKLEMYDNSLAFIHPSLLAAFPNLQTLDMSDNYLNAMAEENFTLFETLLYSLKELKTVYLSNDGLRKLPASFFEGNMYLEVIDLSSNWLKHVTFNLGMLKHLRELNLCNNNIVRLGSDSLNNLNTLLSVVNRTIAPKTEITLHLNPISCASCEDRDSIDWMLEAIKLNLTNTDLQCQQENDTNTEIGEATLEKLQKLCQRKIHIQVSAITTGILLLVIIILSLIIYKRRKLMKHRKYKAEILTRLRDGENAYEFVAFLGYSSDDENFVNTYIINQMNEALQQITGIDRNLICTGDKDFRPGHMVHDEIATCLERSCVMVVLVSDLYCSSVYCRSEFDQAHMYGKPIVLMLRGQVDEDMMSPAMKQLYRRNARILWSEENGEYVLKTTWTNVCSSILDLIK